MTWFTMNVDHSIQNIHIFLGFDDYGRQFDQSGNLINWWQDDTLNEFNTRAKCFIDEVNEKTENIHEQSNQMIYYSNTQRNNIGENIADVGGIKAAYRAYQQFVQQKGLEPMLPYLNYTSNQLFWLSAAQKYCTAMRFTSDSEEYVFNNRTYSDYRIWNAFKNVLDFSNDFNCAPNTAMNPQNKCELW